MPVKINEIPSIDEINKYVVYDAETGFFTNKNGILIGLNDRNYIRLYINKKYYPAHRVAWVIVNGKISTKDQIDHIDGNGKNNKLSNLRLATHANNCRNIGLPKHNTSGIKGVHFNKGNKKWRAQIRLNGVRYWLGDFADIEEAKKSYDDAAKKFHGNFRREEKGPVKAPSQ